MLQPHPDRPQTEQQIIVGSDAIDEFDHVNNGYYLKWVQEAVVAHWRAFAPPADIERIVWFAAEHHVFYRRPALISDQLDIRVWAEGARGAIAYFNVIFTRGGKRICDVTSGWSCIDRIAGKATRVSEELIRIFAPDTVAAEPASDG